MLRCRERVQARGGHAWQFALGLFLSFPFLFSSRAFANNHGLVTPSPDITPQPNVNFGAIEGRIIQIAQFIGALGTIYFVVLVWKNALALARSGDNPQARAAAQSGLWANAVGGVIFFGAAVVAGLYQWLATSGN